MKHIFLHELVISENIKPFHIIIFQLKDNNKISIIQKDSKDVFKYVHNVRRRNFDYYSPVDLKFTNDESFGNLINVFVISPSNNSIYRTSTNFSLDYKNYGYIELNKISIKNGENIVDVLKNPSKLLNQQYFDSPKTRETCLIKYSVAKTQTRIKKNYNRKSDTTCTVNIPCMTNTTDTTNIINIDFPKKSFYHRYNNIFMEEFEPQTLKNRNTDNNSGTYENYIKQVCLTASDYEKLYLPISDNHCIISDKYPYLEKCGNYDNFIINTDAYKNNQLTAVCNSLVMGINPGKKNFLLFGNSFYLDHLFNHSCLHTVLHFMPKTIYSPYRGNLTEIKNYFKNGKYLTIFSFSNNYYIPKDRSERDLQSVLNGHPMYPYDPEWKKSDEPGNLIFNVTIVSSNKPKIYFDNNHKLTGPWVEQGQTICNLTDSSAHIFVSANRPIKLESDISRFSNIGKFTYIKNYDVTGEFC